MQIKKNIWWRYIGIFAAISAGMFLLSQFRNWNSQNVCENQAQHPLEPGGASAGVPFERLSSDTEPACRRAFKYERSVQNALRLGRVLVATGDEQEKSEGFELVKAAYDAGYLPAGVVLSSLLQTGVGTPVDLAAARSVIEAVIAQNPTFVEDASVQRGKILLKTKDFDAQAEGLQILSNAVAKRPELSLFIGDYLADYTTSFEKQQAAEAWYERALDDGVAWGHVSLGILYGDDKSPLFDNAKAHRHLSSAVDAGIVNGWVYAELARRSYFGEGTSKQPARAWDWSQLGSQAGNGYASYLAGVILYLDDGIPNDSLRAEQYLDLAVRQGEESIAQKFLPDVRSRAAAIRRIPKGKIGTNYCIIEESSAYDRNVTYYHNGCGRPIVAYICQSHVAVDIWKALKGEEPSARCKYEKIESGDMMEMFYGADENSSWLRSAVANSTMTWTSCSWPFVPVAGDGKKYICEEQ